MKQNLMYLLTVGLTLVWVGGGLALDKELTIIVGAVVSLVWLLAVFAVEKTIVFPRYFAWFGGLIAVVALSLIWSVEKMETLRQALLLTSGGLWWVGAKTLHKQVRFRNAVRWSILAAGVVFTGLWLLSITKVWQPSYGASSLVVEASAYKNHNHLGDWWMVMIILAFSGGVQWQWVLPGLVMLWTSRSRSADISALVGVGYLAWMHDWWTRHRKKMIVGFGVLVMIFLVVGLNKVTLGSRDYFVQVVAGLTKHPLGVGLGNFGTISGDPAMHWWGRKDFSSVVHCLPLEWVAGMGIFGLVGWVWLGLMSWKMGFASKRDGGIWRAAYWAILINFCLDTTYFVPSMWWIWMVVTGLAEDD